MAAVELVQVGGGVNPDDADPAEPASGQGVANQGAGGARNQHGDAELLRRPLHPAGEVDRVAQRAVLQPPEAAGVADEGFAGVDADAQRQGGLDHRAPALVEPGQFAEHGLRRAAGARGVVGLGQWSIPHREDSVADVVDNHTAVLVNPRGEPLQDVAHEDAGLACPQSLGDPGEAADIADKDRHLAILPKE